MNKKLLVVAVAAAVAAPVTAIADVTIYGKLHMSLDYVMSDNQAASGQDKNNLNVSSNSSRIGFKGSEDLGGGLKGIWQVEQTVSLDSSGSQWATRNSFLGVSSGFGDLLLGRNDTPYKIIGRALDPFGDTIADTRALLGTDADGGSNFDLRTNNAIFYVTPDFQGLSAMVLYSTAMTSPATTTAGPLGGNVGADNNKRDGYSVNLSYTNGPLFVGGAYELHNQQNPDGSDRDAWRLGASYKFGPAKIGGLFEQLKDVPVGGTVTGDRNGFTVFGTYDFYNNTAKLAYTQVDEFDNTTDTGASMYAIGLDHNFSKRTTGYVQYTFIDNDGNAVYGLGGGSSGYGNGVTSDPGADPQAVSVGLIHKF